MGFCFVLFFPLIESVRSRVVGTVSCRRVDRKGARVAVLGKCPCVQEETKDFLRESILREEQGLRLKILKMS